MSDIHSGIISLRPAVSLNAKNVDNAITMPGPQSWVGNISLNLLKTPNICYNVIRLIKPVQEATSDRTFCPFSFIFPLKNLL